MSDNPYLDAYREVMGSGKHASIFGMLAFEMGHATKTFEARRRLIAQYGFAIPNEEALSILCAQGPLVEIGAGKGYWAHLLRRRGADVVCYDKDPVESGRNVYFQGKGVSYMPVHEGDEAVLRQHKDRALLLIWPPYNGPMAARCLEHYDGSTVCYVGEGWGGCTGDNAFFERLEHAWTLTHEVELPRWEGIRDELSIYKRKMVAA